MIGALDQTYSELANEKLENLRDEIDTNTKRYQLTIKT